MLCSFASWRYCPTLLNFVFLFFSIFQMESANGITSEHESIAIEEKHVDMPVPDLNKDGKNDSNVEVHAANGISEPGTKDEGINSSGVAVEASATVPPGKNSKTMKVLHACQSSLSFVLFLL